MAPLVKIALAATVLGGAWYWFKKRPAGSAAPSAFAPAPAAASYAPSAAAPAYAPAAYAPAPSASRAAPAVNLQNPDVSTPAGIQAALNLLGYGPLAVDGILGPKSKAAIQAYQGENGLAADGIAGPLTQASLRSTLAASDSPADFEISGTGPQDADVFRKYRNRKRRNERSLG